MLQKQARPDSHTLTSTKKEHDSAHMFKLDEDPSPVVVDWEGHDDLENPRNWTTFEKNLHVVMISLFTLNA
jgi:hypothetical protein